MQKVTSLYLHFPHCRHLCNYCDFYKKLIDNRENQISSFHNQLLSQWKVHAEFLNQNQFEIGDLETFYIGGGTPSLWGIEGADFLSNFFRINRLSLNPTGEHTMEVNPGSWNEKIIDSWRHFGINRFSIGLQTLNKDMLPFLDRVHSISESHHTLKYFSDLKVNWSADFMLGIPESKNRNLIQELDEILSYNPQHLSLYILTVKPQYKYYNKLPDEIQIEDEFLMVSEYLQSRGYKHYEVSNFALDKCESRHNLKYWQCESVAALGPSATGFLNINSHKAIRYKWKTQENHFEIENLSEKELFLEKIYLNLRTNNGLEIEDLIIKNCSEDKITKLINKWDELNYLTCKSPIILNAKGYLILDSLIGEIFSEFKHL